jgi:Tfp pilus assembly protein PilX
MTGATMKRRLASFTRRDDSGMALLMVVASMLVLTMLATAGLAYALRGQTESRRDQDWSAALQTAQAGVQDYISLVNSYGSTYNSNATYYCANPAMLGGTSVLPTACPAAGWGTVAATAPGNGWVRLTNPSTGFVNPTPAYYHYDIDTSKAGAFGTVVVTSTGRVNKVGRTVQATVTNGGATDYVYFTDYEAPDPRFTAGCRPTPSGFSAPAHWWELTQSQRTSVNAIGACSIQFAPVDNLAGPVHSNDTPLIAGGATFGDTYDTSDPACQTAVSSNGYALADPITDTNGCYRATGAGNPSFAKAPQWVKAWQPLDTTATLLPTAQSVGCVYTGPTRIVFNSNGTMTVWSRYSTASLPNWCGAYLTLNTGAPQTVTIPPNFLVYVVSGGAGANGPCPNTVGSGANSATIGGNATVGYLPIPNDDNFATADQHCNLGNLYVEGTVKGQLTAVADNSVVITGDLLYAGGPNGTDLLGLVALNFIEYIHPVSGNTEISSFPNEATNNVLQVNAALESLQHVVYVQSFDKGSNDGTLALRGTIAQKYRGPVGTGNSSGVATGYAKNYVYDTRLKYGAPPYFPHWQNASWRDTLFGEIPKKY